MQPLRERYDVVIVGGAAVGSAAAYFLAADPAFAGASLLVVEKDASYREAATTLSAASIRHQFSTPENIRLSQFGTAFLREVGTALRVDDEVPNVGFREGGYLFLAGPEGLTALETRHETQRALGADVRLLKPQLLAECFPWLATGDLAGASLGLSGEGWLDAWSLLRALKRKARSLRAEYVEDCVVGLSRRGRRIESVRLAGGVTVGCRWLLNCAGTGATSLAALVGIELPVEARKRCVFHFQCATPISGSPLVVDPSGAWFRPEGPGWIAGIAPPPGADPVDPGFEVDWSQWEERLWPLLAARVPAFEAVRVKSAWAGHYDVNTLDCNAILGPHPGLDNLLFANGFSGHGLQQAPAVGRALAEWVTTGASRSLDLSRFGWARVLAGQALRESEVV